MCSSIPAKPYTPLCYLGVTGVIACMYSLYLKIYGWIPYDVLFLGHPAVVVNKCYSDAPKGSWFCCCGCVSS